MIQGVDLCKRFRRTITQKDGKNSSKSKKLIREKNVDFFAVNHVNIEANAGEVLGLLGPNGAGKTTLLRMLGCLMEPTSGQVIINDRENNIIAKNEDMKLRIGYLSGNTKLYHRFSCRELLSIMGEIYGLEKSVVNERIERICSILKMEEFIDNRIERLSTGQTQRANISRCLIHEPDIYIFDEPTLGLDIISSQAIIEFMKNEKERGKTIIYSTHYMEEAQYLCDRIVMMHQGQIIDQGSPEELMRKTETDNLRDTFQTIIKKREEIKASDEVQGDVETSEANNMEGENE